MNFGFVVIVLMTLIANVGIAKAPEAVHFTLENGLQVVVLPNHRAPTVSHLLWYRAGSADDPYTKTGIAHFLEHMMFKGPKGSASERISQAVESLGGLQNAMTTYDFTMYYNIVASMYLKDVMALEAGRLQHLVVQPEDAKTELNVVFEERRMRFENDPFGEFVTLLMGKFFQYHPYRNPPIGWEGDLSGLTAEDAQKFYDAHYAPNNSVLILAGDITPEAAKIMATTYYGALPKKQLVPRVRVMEPARSEVQTSLKFSSPFIAHPAWVRLYPLPKLKGNQVQNSMLFSVVEHLLTVDPWGHLFKELVKNKKIATSISVDFMYPHVDSSLVYVSAEPLPGKDIDALEAELLQAVKDLAEKGVTLQDVEKAKSQLLVQTAFNEDSLMGAGMFYGEHLMMGANFEDIEKRDDALKAVTVEDVNQLLKNIFTEPYHLTGYLLPQNPAPQTIKGEQK